jgi:AcrR family transcriptional regulator
MSFVEPADGPPERALVARERILDTAYELFSRHGVRVVGVNRIIAEAGVAKMTFYRYFPSKADLILAFLDVRRQRWTYDWLLTEVQKMASTPRERTLAFFGALDQWFHTDDYDGCAFIATLLEVRDTTDPIHQEAARQLELIRTIVRDQADQAGAGDPENTAHQLQILMMGAIVSATRGDLDAGRRAGELARMLLDSKS